MYFDVIPVMANILSYHYSSLQISYQCWEYVCCLIIFGIFDTLLDNFLILAEKSNVNQSISYIYFGTFTLLGI